MTERRQLPDMRFSFISDLCSKTVVKPKESKEHRRSRKIDKLLTGKYTAIPMFIAIMLLIFWLTFNVIGAFLQNLLESGIEKLTAVTDVLLSSANVNEVLHSLIIDGIFSGVGSVLSFVPIIVILFLFLSLLEDSGYMARVAFVMDKLLQQNRSVRQKYCSHAYRFRMHCPCRYVQPYPSVRTRPQNDSNADAVYELYGKTPDLWIFRRRFLSEIQRPCDGFSVFYRYFGRNSRSNAI